MKSSRWIFGLVLGIGVYAIFVFFSDISQLKNQLEMVEIKYIGLAVSVVFFGLVIRALRWHVMLKNLDVNINVKSSMLLYFSGTAFGLSPGRLGEVIKSHYLKRLVNTPISLSAPTIIVERFLDVFAILVIALFAFLLTGIQHVSIILGFTALITSIYLIYQKKHLYNTLKILEQIPLLGRLSQKLIPALDVIFILTKPKALSKTLSLSILSWFSEAFVIYFVLMAFGIELSIIKSQFIFVISSLIGAISFLPGGIGATEGGLLGLLLLENISYNDAIAPILVIRMIILWMTIVFGIIINRVTELTILKNR